jgi:hypothetical protein
MEQINRTAIAEAIATQSPGWARVGLTMRDPELRRRAADAIAAVIIEVIEPDEQPDPRQLPLSF